MLRFDPIDAFEQEHVALRKMFALHQEALITRAWARAAHLLEHYRKRLRQHIHLEERYLLPYCPPEKTTDQWPARVYLSEHRRAEELLDQAVTRLAQARRRGVKPASLIALLDEEKTLKSLMDHHDDRENMALFRLTRASMPDAAQLELTQALRHLVSTARRVAA